MLCDNILSGYFVGFYYRSSSHCEEEKPGSKVPVVVPPLNMDFKTVRDGFRVLSSCFKSTRRGGNSASQSRIKTR